MPYQFSEGCRKLKRQYPFHKYFIYNILHELASDHASLSSVLSFIPINLFLSRRIYELGTKMYKISVSSLYSPAPPTPSTYNALAIAVWEALNIFLETWSFAIIWKKHQYSIKMLYKKKKWRDESALQIVSIITRERREEGKAGGRMDRSRKQETYGEWKSNKTFFCASYRPTDYASTVGLFVLL